jgi:hypothetical protein
MPIWPRTGKILLFFLVLFFLAGVVQLFSFRFDIGDTYPEYSSLRNDPLGTKIFYEALAGIKGIKVSRNFRPVMKMVPDRETTLFVFGASLDLIDEVEEVKAVEEIAKKGGRVVLLLHPDRIRPHKKDKPAELNSFEKKSGEKPDPMTIEERWGFSVERLNGKKNNQEAVANIPDRSENLPLSIRLLASFYFKKTVPEWRDMYFKEGETVLMERNWGKGSMVLSTDSFMVSNEALAMNRSSELLTWFVGPNQHVIFEESHLGLGDKPGIISLARKYRLFPFVSALLVLSALVIWKNSRNLVPPLKEDEGSLSDDSGGKNELSGFSGLLKRKIPPAEILTACHSEWKEEGGHRKRVRTEMLEEIDWLVAGEKSKKGKEQNPVKTYNAIRAMINERKRHHE